MQKYLLLALLLLWGCSSDSSTSTTPPETTLPIYSGDSVNCSLGFPQDTTPEDDYIIVRPQYILSYNSTRGVPNWVAWELDASWYGDAPRYDGDFITDNTLPSAFYHVKHSDYTNSGYDRGHMVMSEQRTRTVADNKATFYMTNILPQKPDLNRGVWLDLESYCEKLCVDSAKKLFIYAGGVYHGNTSIGGGHVAVPDSCFKIIVVLDKNQTIRDISVSTRVIAVMMPNIAGVRNDDWEKYATTIRRIESSTGYDFDRLLPKAVQDAIESR